MAQNGQLDAQITALTQQNGVLSQQISDRQREIVEAQTAAWLVEEARKLGYVFPGEKVYLIMPPGSQLPASGGVVAPLPSYSPIATPSPSPTPSPQPTPTAPTPTPTPTPYQFTLPTPQPSPR